MAEQLRAVGVNVKDTSGFAKVTGRAKFYNDIQLPNMLHAKLLRSPYARANIVNIDTSEAEALPGVELVMTYKNFPKLFFQAALYVGMEVACVVAEDKNIAKQALGLIKVEYAPQPFIIDPAAAMKFDAPIVFPGRPNEIPFTDYKYWIDRDENGLFTKRVKGEFDGYGDVAQARLESDLIVEDEGFAYNKAHAPVMSPSGCVASFEDGELTIWMPSQNPYAHRQSISAALGVPLNKVHLYTKYTGGAFGARLAGGMEPSMVGPSFTAVASVASMKLGKPVSLFYSRDEDFLFFWGRGSFNTKVAIGFKKDGTLVMMDSEIWRNASTGGGNRNGNPAFRRYPHGDYAVFSQLQGHPFTETRNSYQYPRFRRLAGIWQSRDFLRS